MKKNNIFELDIKQQDRLLAVLLFNKVFPMILLPEISVIGKAVNQEEVKRLLKLRNDVFITYPYALTAAAILKNVNSDLEKNDRKILTH